MKIAVVAGELSGDQLGAQLMQEFKTLDPQAEFYGIGGPNMASNGCDCWHTIDALSVMGLAVIPHIPRLLKLRASLIRALIDDPPYVILPVACTLPVTVKVPPVTSCNFFGALLGRFASMYALSLSGLG